MRNRISRILLVEVQNVVASLKKILAVFLEINKHTAHTTSSCTLGHLSQINKMNGLHKNLYILFLADLFVIIKNSKETKYLSIGEWLSKLWHMHITKYCSTVKRSELLI